MKRMLSLLSFLLFTSLYAQSSIGVYAGYGQSAFEDDFFGGLTEDQAGYVPVGAQLTIGKGMFQFGIDAHYSVIPFTWEVESNGIKQGELKITQLFGGAFARFNIKMANERITPFIRGGVGAYLGELKAESADGDEEMSEDFKTAVGFFAAPGIDFKVGPTGVLFVEVPIHFVKRELDVDSDASESRAANNYALVIGYRLLFR